MYIVVLVTVANKKQAVFIARRVLASKLVACVNVVNGLESFFWWEGKIDRAHETLLIMKTKKTKFTQVKKLVKSIHPYSVPEIIALPIREGFQPYLRWIDDSVRKSV